jgi:hypothetical protein
MKIIINTYFNRLFYMFLFAFFLSEISFAGVPGVFKNTQLPTGPIQKLKQHNAQARPLKSVWLLRESSSVPGALSVTYYDLHPQSPTGFTNKQFVFDKIKGWIWTGPSMVAELTGSGKDSFIPIYADSADRHPKQLESLYEMLKSEVGLDRAGQIVPE